MLHKQEAVTKLGMAEKAKRRPQAIINCRLCGYEGPARESNHIRSNIRRYREKKFLVARCPICKTLQSKTPDNLEDYYKEYPLLQTKKNTYIVNCWNAVILGWLKENSVKKTHSVLDHGCGHGVLIDNLQRDGFKEVYGYDIYSEQYGDSSVLNRRYDVVISMDVIEHVQSPKDFMQGAYILAKSWWPACNRDPAR